MTEIGEPVKVGAVFDPQRVIVPKWFIWNRRRYDIRKVTFTWKVRDGQKTFHHFAVTDGSDLYELTYDVASLSWMLMGVSVGSGEP
jgi:hypothetical protein